MVPPHYLLAASLSLFAVGAYCLVAKTNMIRILIGLSIAGNAVNLSFIGLSAFRAPDPLAQAVVIIAIVAEACIVAVGLTIAIHAYRHYQTLDVRKLSRLKW